jgi:hypothetical protein
VIGKGDRVRVIEDPDGLVVGWEGVVIARSGDCIRVFLDADDMPSSWFNHELEIVE